MLEESPEFRLFLKAYSERKAPLTIFTGSGISAPAGLPNWPALEKKLRTDVDLRMRQANEFKEKFNEAQYAALKSSADPWISFKLIKSILGEPTFNGLIEMYLSPPDSATVPIGYDELLSLNPQGLVTLNLDRFAGEATYSSQARFSNPIYGKELSEKWNAIIDKKPHLIYLHGDILNPSTWVLTKDDLDHLENSEAHKLFLYEKYQNNLVLFTGISADDRALSLRLLELRNGNLRPPNLFWLTSRQDSGLQDWADRHFIKLIRYEGKKNEDHLDAIRKLVRACSDFVPQEPKLEPIHNAKIKPESAGDPASLARQAPETIRYSLSAGVNEIISQTTPDTFYEKYREFCKNYHFSIHQAFYRNDSDEFREWFSYRLSFPATGRGNFGEVYSATDREGNLVAVKIMNESAFYSNEMLGGFRRGVQSMKIVNDSGVEGMVPLLEAYELPPTIVMPYVAGVSLQQAIERRKDLSWETKVRIGKKTADIVSSAHALPSTVLHRDLKPSNIMIENFEYSGEFDPDVIVLDFDMSWHKGSNEKDVVFESRDDFGFLSPEQTDPTSVYHARTTKVDSYGLAMTIYYLFGGVAPLANEPLNPDWPRRVNQSIRQGYNYDWKSAPNRLTRVVVSSTAVDQYARWDFFRLKSQLSIIEKCIVDPGQQEDAEAWGEELLANIGSSVPYTWDDDKAIIYFT